MMSFQILSDRQAGKLPELTSERNIARNGGVDNLFIFHYFHELRS
jgi:hypothetical protein